MKNAAYLLALHSIDGLGPIRLKAVIDYFEDPKVAWEARGEEFLQIGIPKNVVSLFLEKRKTLDPEKFAKDVEDSGIKWMSVFDENYPQSLKQIYDPPTILYYLGEILPEDINAIGVVGTRKMTDYGKIITTQFTKKLAGQV